MVGKNCFFKSNFQPCLITFTFVAGGTVDAATEGPLFTCGCDCEADLGGVLLFTLLGLGCCMGKGGSPVACIAGGLVSTTSVGGAPGIADGIRRALVCGC